MHVFHPSILREYDIRGVFNETLFPEDLYNLGRIMVRLTQAKVGKQPRIVVGYDGRLSSPELVAALHKGLLEEGAHVLSVGCGPTPMISFAHYALESDAALMVTGSHNPKTHNGLKMTLQTHPFFGDDIRALQDQVAMLSEISFPNLNSGYLEKINMESLYVQRLIKDINITKNMKIVWDPGNGAAGRIIERLVKYLPGEHILLNIEIDGTFPAHHPDPTVPENLEEIKNIILQEKADLGFAFDGDADRLGVVDGKGRILWGDQILIFLAEFVLKTNPGAPIIADIKASQVLFDKIKEFGGFPVMERTGHSLIKSKMREIQAPLAGEMSGHIFFSDRYYGFDDALYAALRVLEILNSSEKTLADFYEALPKFESTPEIRLECQGIDKKKIIQKIKEGLIYEKIPFNQQDGIRIRFEQGWWGIRASNTQDVLTIRVEASSVQELYRLKEDLLRRLKPFGLLF